MAELVVVNNYVYWSNFANQHLPSTFTDGMQIEKLLEFAISQNVYSVFTSSWEMALKAGRTKSRRAKSNWKVEQTRNIFLFLSIWSWTVRNWTGRLSAFNSDKHFGKLITKPSMRCTGYQSSNEILWDKLSNNLFLLCFFSLYFLNTKSSVKAKKLKLQILCWWRQKIRESFVLRFWSQANN